MGLLGGASGCIGRCLDILNKHQKSKPSAFELVEMRGKLEEALGAVHEVAHNLEVKAKQDHYLSLGETPKVVGLRGKMSEPYPHDPDLGEY